jgi:uncharacterized protein
MGPKRLLVFVKAPRPGTVKTRLARAVGHVAAAELYRRLAERVLDETRDPGRGWTQAVCFDPPDARDELRAWLGPGRVLVPQQGGDLGERMAGAFSTAFAAGGVRVALVGSDVPSLSREAVRRALDALSSDDVVLGPSLDGGYYLIGLKHHEPELFRGIGWSGPDVLRQTLERAGRLGLSVYRLGPLRDVDTIEDLRVEWPRVRGLIEDPAVLDTVERALDLGR